ncbi:MAG: recombination mediator RecR, partial [Saprospiraceae bacterium]
MNQISKILDDAVGAFSSLPGIGKKSALRLALHLAKLDKQKAMDLARAIQSMAENLKTCKSCFAYSDEDLCAICKDTRRDHRILCVVESVRDLFAIEEVQMFKGIYHILGGLISPIDGIGPEQLQLDSLFEKLEKTEVSELILAIRPTIEGDTTAYYISKNLPNPDIKLT